MQKPKSLEKSSFSLLETILALLILSIVVGGFLNSSYYNNSTDIFFKLQNIKNNFLSKTYDNHFTQKNYHLNFSQKNSAEVILLDTGNIRQHTYNSAQITLVKYEMDTNTTIPESKEMK